MLPRLNPAEAHYSDARGINPPMMRAMCHIGYAIGKTEATSEDAWGIARGTIIDELREAQRHLAATEAQGFSASPFLSPMAIQRLNVVGEQVNEMVVSAQESNKADTFRDLTMLAENMTYTSALAENYVIGSGADEGRNP